MSKHVMKVQIELLDYWHVGSGHGRGTHLDAIVDRDGADLPYVPGKMIKGLLRSASYCLVQWGHFEEEAFSKLFGNERLAGSLYVSDARLPEDVSKFLADKEQKELRERLFAEHFSTSIDEEGVAKDKSLRGIELVIPCTLLVEMEVHESGSHELIKQAIPLVRSLGAHRSRGLGRCILSVVEG